VKKEIKEKINMNKKLVEINKIKFDGTKQVNEKLVDILAASIETVGLLNPIVLTPDFELVAGRLRIEAYRTMGYLTIPATIVTLDEMHRRIATIDENLIRKQLTKLEMAEQLSERKKIYEALYPETRRGVAGALAKHNGATEKISFAKDFAEKTGQTERNVNYQIAIYENLHPEVRELVRESAIANNFSELKRLSAYDLDTQLEYAGLIQAGKANGVAAANRLFDATFKFENTDKGKFQKSVRLAEKALKQLIDDGIVKELVEGISEEKYVFFRDELLTDLNSLKNLKNRIQIAINIFEDKMRELDANTYTVHANNQELALAE
jgi:ParB family transcriptional regulator, chromosome partitioning protein